MTVDCEDVQQHRCIGMMGTCFLKAWTERELLIYSEFVIPAKAGIQKNQQTGHRLSPV
jgi:hypothetical protein